MRDDDDWGPDDRVGLGPDPDDAELWDMHPVADDDQVEQERLYRAALPPEGPEPDTAHCRDCGAPLFEEDEPFTMCASCLPEAMRRDPWPWPLPQEMP